MTFFAPNAQFWLHRPLAYGQPGIQKSWLLNTLFRADISNSVGPSIGSASFQFADVDGSLWRDVFPQPMDAVRIYLNAPNDPQLRVAWTGFVDSSIVQYDPTAGNILVINATSPWKMFENTRLAISANINDALTLALAEVSSGTGGGGGISARDLIKFAILRCGYPGCLNSIPQPAGFHLYPGSEIAGQEIWQVPDNIGSEPDLQTWASILSGLATDTGCELFFDEFGSLIFRPVQFLATTPPALAIDPTLVLSASIGVTDQNVVTSVRVRWSRTGSYETDGYWYAGQKQPQGSGNSIPQQNFVAGTMQNQLGVRELTIQAPWISSIDAANFLAMAVGEMAAANVGVGTITIPCDPLYRTGSLVDVPSLATTTSVTWSQSSGSAITRFYVLGVVHSLQWGEGWYTTLQLGYGRSPNETFPYTLNVPQIVIDTRPNYIDPAGQYNPSLVTAGLPGAAGTSTPQTPSTLKQDSSLNANSVLAPPQYPVGSVLRIYDKAGNIIGNPANGEYTVTGNTVDGSVHLLHTNGQATVGKILVVQQTGATSATTSPVTSAYQSTAGGTTPAGALGASSTQATYGSLATDFVHNWHQYRITQRFGPTPVKAEPPLDGYLHYHTGIDLAVPAGTQLYAPVSGTVLSAAWDTSGYGWLVTIESNGYIFYFAHLTSFSVKAGDSINAGTPFALTGWSGNVLPQGPGGAHLHFGVQVASQSTNATLGYINPLPWLNSLTN